MTRCTGIIVRDYYIAYAAPLASRPSREPTEEEYNRMMALTVGSFTRHLELLYKSDMSATFIGLEFSIKETRFNFGIPTARFRIYIDFDTNILYTEGSSVPTPDEAFDLDERCSK